MKISKDKDYFQPINAMDSSYQGSISSPINKRKKITWRNDSDYLNALSHGKTLKKDAKNMRAHEAANLNYGERDG